ncbi:uncharacterized protein V1510DRAFT_415085 [Dipodascopsis tothii]|uniref:uncharacterized protein n=1 Tax=Dipodascopsis tothii TaxID=44089 RepID=UPI0034CD3A0C
MTESQTTGGKPKRKHSGAGVPAETKKERRSSSSGNRRASGNVLSGLKVPIAAATCEPLGNPAPTRGFFRVKTSMYVSIAPMYSLWPIKGIRAQHIDPLVMTYFAPAGGVVLACLDVQLDGPAKISAESPFAFAWATVEFLVWKPKRGDILQGRINMQSPSHIGLLVFDAFNASITRDRIPSSWRFVENELDEDFSGADAADNEDEAEADEDYDDFEGKSLGYWVDEHGRKIDDKLTFVIESIEVSGKLVSVDGSLLKLGEVKEDLTAPGTGI